MFEDYKKPILKTFWTTLLILLLLVCFLALNFYVNPPKPDVKQAEKFQTEMIGQYISRYLEQESENPTNYKINIELATLYEMLNQLDVAEDELYKAIKKAPYGVYEPIFKLAELFLLKGDYEQAVSTIETIPLSRNIKLIRFKADFYFELATLLKEEGNFKNAIKSYKTALFYKKKIGSIQKISKDLSDSYIKYADEKFKSRDFVAAIENLNLALDYVKSDIALYKLGLIYIDIDKKSALDYFDQVYKSRPTLINYEIYQRLMDDYSKELEEQNKPVLSKLYAKKGKNIKRFADSNILIDSDIKLIVENLKIKEMPLKLGKKISMDIKFINNCAKPLNKLDVELQFINADIMIKKENFHLKAELGDESEPFLSKSFTTRILYKKWKAREKKIDINIYASKNLQFNNLYLGTITIDK